jgi:hypothetical protein
MVSPPEALALIADTTLRYDRQDPPSLGQNQTEYHQLIFQTCS